MQILNVDGIEVPIGTHAGKKIFLASDHRGFSLKNSIINALKDQGFEVEDLGTFSDERCDYTFFSDSIGRHVSENFPAVGISICGSGIGAIIPASKHQGVYAARCFNAQDASQSRRHNNTNLLGIGADFTSKEEAIVMAMEWLSTPFYSKGEDRYLQRFVQTVKMERGI